MRHIDFRRVFVFAGLASLVIVYAILWLQMIASPSERTGADFIGFFTAARIFQKDGADKVYDPAYQQMIEQQEVGFELVPGQVLLFNHLPYFLPLLNVIVDANYVNSFIRWVIVLLVFLVIDAVFMAGLLPTQTFRRGDILIAAAGALLFFPTFTSLMNGQDTVFLLLGMTLWLYGMLSNRDVLAGLGLSLVTIRPQLALVLAVPLFFSKERRRVCWWFMIGTILLGVLCLMILGWEGAHNLANFLLISAGGQWYGLHPEDMPTLSGLIRRTAPGTDLYVIQFISWGIYLIAIAGLSIHFWKNKKIREQQIGLAVLVGLFVVPYLHYHDLACLLIPIFCLARVLVGGNFLEARNTVLLPLALSFFLLVGFYEFSIRYLVVYIVMIGVTSFLWFPDRLYRAFHLQRSTP
ncbi:MAG TPA: glycosyltransferase family 87 protein [Anaerolineaceae bacterium]